MNKETNKLIPELRFLEFKNDGRWEEKKLGNIGDPSMCKRIFKEETTTNSTNGIPFYKIGTFGKEADSFISNEIYEEYKTKFSFPKKGEILISASGTIGRLVVYDGEPAFFQDSNIVWISNDENEVQNNFLYYIYSLVKWQTSDGGIIQRLYNADLKSIDVFFPKNKNEQQKIADCLSSLDNLITAHTDKLETLKTYKKGLMQNLFPQEGENVPKFRFKEFEKDGQWKTEKIENYIDLFSGIALKSEEISDDQSGIPILRGINITEGYVRHSKDIDKYFLGNLENLKKYLIKEYDIVIGMDGSKVGKNVALIGKEDENSILIQRVARIRTKKNANIKFVYQHFISDNFRNYVDKVNTSSGIPHISSQQIKDFEISFPPVLDEQNKIANTLSYLDNLIHNQVIKIEQLKSHKKGLMQGLFPRAN